MNIPNFPVGAIVKDDKTPTDSFVTFLQQLISVLQTNAGQEGLVAASQSSANVTTIQNNQLPNGAYTCQYGTFLYDSGANSIRVAINNGAGAPIFKTVTVS